MGQLIFECKSYRPREFTGGTVFIIAAFRTRRWHYGPIVNALNKKGFNVYIYDYPSRPLLTAQPEEWVEVTERLARDIATNIRSETSKYPGTRFGIIGVSVGSALALYAAKTIKELEKIMLVTVYGSSAMHVWEHPQLRKIRDKFESTGRDIKDAAAVFGFLEPMSHLDLIADRSILLYANERDPVIRFSNTQLFIDEAKRHGIKLLVRRVSAKRHSTTILKVFKEPVLWLPFFIGLKYPKSSHPHNDELMVG